MQDNDFQSTPKIPQTDFLSVDERDAMEYVRDLKGFYVHALAYVVVMVGLVIINLMTSSGYFWVKWPAVGWGIALAIHGLSVFEVIDLFGPDWEKRQIERRMRRK